MTFLRHLILLILLTVPAQSQAGTVTDRFLGVFSGDGLVTELGQDSSEALRCRMVGKSVGENQVNLTGKCVTPRGATNVVLMLAQDAVGARFAAKVVFAANNTALELNGGREDDTITLATKAPIEQDGTNIIAELKLVAAVGGNIEMSNLLTDTETGKQTRTFQITLIRKR